MIESEGSKRLQEALDAAGFHGMSEREEKLRRASAYYWGTQYAGLPDHEAGHSIREKKPRVQARLVKRAVDEVNSYLYGRNRKPSVSAGEDAADELGERVQTLYGDPSEGIGLRAKLAEVGRLCLLHGSALIAFHRIVPGDGIPPYLSLEVSSTTMADPTFGDDDKMRAAQNGISSDELLELDEYWYDLNEDPVTGERDVELHRRRYTLTATIEYRPIDVEEVSEGSDIRWTVDEERTVEHDLGYVPAEWVTNGPRVANDVDGVPLLGEAEFSLADSLNYTLSQLDRGVQYNQEPQTVFSNVHADDVTEIEAGAQTTWALPPGIDKDPSVEMLELDGGGQETALEFAKRVRDLLYEAASVAIHDPELAAGVQSGTALERILRPTIAMVDKLRPSQEVAITRLLEKIVEAEGLSGDATVEASWPAAIEPTAEDLQLEAQAAVALKKNNLLLRKEAISRVARHYGVDDLEEYLERLNEELGGGGTVDLNPPAPNQAPEPDPLP